MKSFQLTYKPFGERSILVEWPSKIDKKILDDVVLFKKKIKNSNIKKIVYINSAFNSLLISYHLTIDNFYDALLELKSIYSSQYTKKNLASKLWRIPVCYDTKFGVDLDDFSKGKKRTKDEIIDLHSRVDYTVFFIGFLPGFLYLGGLEKELFLPRKGTPNLHVKKGSIAIGGEQTGIYPQDSPGGWHIIGNSPINLFDVTKKEPCFASAGDQIRCVPIDINTYNEIKTLVQSGVYQLESEVIDD